MLYLFQSVWALPHTRGISAFLSGDAIWLPGAIALLALLLFALWRWHGRTTQRFRRKMGSWRPSLPNAPRNFSSTPAPSSKAPPALSSPTA